MESCNICIHDYENDEFFAYVKNGVILKGALIHSNLSDSIRRSRQRFELVKDHEGAKNIEEICEIVLGFTPFPSHMERYVYPAEHKIKIITPKGREIVTVIKPACDMEKIFGKYMKNNYDFYTLSKNNEKTFMRADKQKLKNYFNCTNIESITIKKVSVARKIFSPFSCMCVPIEI